MRRLLVILCLLFPTFGIAQQAATLVADDVVVTADQRLIANGNVEVLYQGTRLSAASITYDQPSDRLLIGGPIFIRAEDGTIFTADQASLDPQLANGILLGARLVLGQQLQMAANQITRVDGNLTQLYKVAATSCAVCGNQTPLWEIRAERVVHDQAARQLYFENATFRVIGVPVFWVPRMRLPDPSLTRATGLLVPSFRTSTDLGFGVKLPYFIKLGDSRDLTLTPYLGRDTRTLEADFAAQKGLPIARLEGAVSRDAILPDETRGYIFAAATFRLPKDYQLAIDIEGASDKTYLLDYGFGGTDRLESTINLTQVRADSLFQIEAVYFQTLRTTEDNATLPPVVFDLGYRRDLYPAALGGTLTLSGDVEAHQRYSSAPGDEQRDVARLALSADWTRDWMLGGSGLLAQTMIGANVDYYRTTQDPAIDPDVIRSTPYVMTTLRWPLMRSTPEATQIIEPVVSLAWSETTGGTVANEDSTRVEFDSANLIALSRFPGEDAYESGFRLATGITWSRVATPGNSARLTFGRVFRETANADFSTTSGLSGTRSDWLLAGQFDFGNGLRLDGRAVLDGTFTPQKTEARIAWGNAKLDLAASYVWLPTDLAEDRDDDVSEWNLDAAYRLNDRWSVGLNGRYDVAARVPAYAGLDVGWQNECVTVALSVSRRYTSSTILNPTTDFGLSVSLNGFSAGRSGGVARASCAN